jgi:hypothetical protein
MPRVGATLGVLTTIALCIGFNLCRYPVVWEMLDTGSDGSAIAGTWNAPEAKGPAAPVAAPSPIARAITAKKARPVAVPAAARAAISGKYAAAPVAAIEASIKARQGDGKPAKPAEAKNRPSARPKTGDAAKPRSAAVKTAHNRPDKKSRPGKLPAHDKPAPITPRDPVADLAQSENPIGDEPRKRLVPVNRHAPTATAVASRTMWISRVSNEPGNVGSYDHTILRLPPVDWAQPPPLPPLSSAGPIPFYPTTGLN